MDLQRRVELLERQNSWFKRIGIATVLLVIVAISMGQAPKKAETIEAEKFVIVDEHGAQRGIFGIDQGDAILILAHADGKPLIEMRTIRDGRSALHVHDTNGIPRIELALAKRGPVLNFIGDNSVLRTSLAGAGPNSRLDLYQDDGGKIFTVTTEELEFYNADGKTVVFSQP